MSDRLQLLINGNNENEKKKSFIIYIVLPMLLVLLFFVYNFENPADKKRAIQALDSYISANYTTELDRFTKGENIVPYKESGLLGDKTKAYAYYYSQPEKGWGQFEIVSDLEGNIVYDGYKEWYLTGGMTFERYNENYRNLSYEHKNRLYNQGINKDILSVNDMLRISSYLESSQLSVNTWGHTITSPQLEPEKEYDQNELAREYGHINIYLETGKDIEKFFPDFALMCRDYINSSGLVYKEVMVYIRPKIQGEILNVNAVFTREEMTGNNFTETAKSKMAVYTKQQKEADIKTLNETGVFPDGYYTEWSAGLHLWT